jgi:phosphoribosylamine-glycine ligase
MKIGFIDGDGLMAIQSHFLNDGHEVHLWSPGVTKEPGPRSQKDKNEAWGEFLYPVVKEAKSLDRLRVHECFESLVNVRCDLYIASPGMGVIEEKMGYEYEALQAEGFPVIGYAGKAWALENYRSTGRLIARQIGLETAHADVFHNPKLLIKYLEKRRTPCVLKQVSSSPFAGRNRTVVAVNPKQAASMIKKPNAWWGEDGVGGVLLEDFLPGQEVCWGAWFNGQRFVEPLYSCIEHKGAQDEDRGSVLTGEVGTPMHFHCGLTESNSRVWKIFRNLEPFLAGHCHGLVDINTIVNYETGSISFVEFTMRFGIPTMEVMLAMVREGVSFGDRLLQVTQGRDDAMQSAFREDYAVGVVVYSYGYPLLDESMDGASDMRRLQRRSLTHEIEFEFPSIEGRNAKVQQMFCGWLQRTNTFLSQTNERQFIVVGFGVTPELARREAYETLCGYWLLGHTWRSDIGATLPALYKHGVRLCLFPSTSCG